MRILGIDWGSSSIKAVEMDSAFGRYDIHDYHEQSITPETPPEKALSQLISSLPKTPDRIIVSLPNSASTFRNLQLPTRDKKAIQAGVGFELEDELPFPTEESVLDYVILSQGKQGSYIHVAATIKKHLTSAIASWQGGQVDPDFISTESWAYRTLLNRVLGPNGQAAPVLLAQLGHEKTTFYLHWLGAPSVIREISWGGRDLNLALCKEMGIPIEQAESMKIDHGTLETLGEGSAEPSAVSQCLEKAMEPLARELRQMSLISKNVTHQTISLVYLSGGTSILPGISEWLQSKINIPVKPLLALSAVTSSGVTYSNQTDARFLLAASLTLCLVGPERAHCINFRKRAFAKQGKGSQLNWQLLRKPMIYTGIVATCLLISLIVQSIVYQSRLESTNIALEKSVRSFFGQISSSALRTYMNNTSTLRSSINRELNKQREMSRLYGANPHSPIDFLNTLSSTIPRDVILDLTLFQAGTPPADPFTSSDHSTSLTFIVANPQMAEKLAVVLGNKLTGMQRGKMEEVASSDGTDHKWKITFSGKPSEDSYGKQ